MKFSPLLFLASLGAGGISVIPFALLQYVHPHGKGLITLHEILTQPAWDMWTYWILGAVMLIFAALHIVLSLYFLPNLIAFVRSDVYQGFIKDPIKNAAIMAPFIALIMTMNVFIGPIRFFITPFAENLQLFMLPALLFWLGIGIFL